MRSWSWLDRVIRYVVLMVLLVPPLTVSVPSTPVAASRIIPPDPLPPATPLANPVTSNPVPQPSRVPQSRGAHAQLAPPLFPHRSPAPAASIKGKGRSPQTSTNGGAVQSLVASTSIENAYIKVPAAADGRFVMGTTGGSPNDPDDDNKQLLYGYTLDDIFSTYSSLRITNGSTTFDYRLGDDNTGLAADLSPISGPTVSGTTMTTSYLKNGVRVDVQLQLVTNPATGREDTTAIQYTLTNTNSSSRSLGLRIMLDVLVGTNDGAPYVVPGVGQVTQQREWTGAAVPPYFLTYESGTFAADSFIARGDLTGGTASTPNRFVIADWPQVVGGPLWDYTVDSSDSITNDSAVLMYYDPVTVGANQSVMYRTFYGMQGRTLPPDQRNTEEPCDCPDSQYDTDHPVNTRTGNFWTRVQDVQVDSPGPRLAWSRTYASQMLGTSGTFGYGWYHPYSAQLITPAMNGGEPGVVSVLSPSGNRLRYTDLGGGQYQALPGIYSSLVQAGSVFTQTLRDQTQYIFNSTGRLTGLRDALGRRLTLTYNGSNQLTQVTDAGDSSRTLVLTYTSNRLTRVAAGTRGVDYRYDANGDLDRVTDVMGRFTYYAYVGTSHRLREIKNNLNQVVESMTYDTATPPRVQTQTLQDGRQLQFGYLTASTVITTTGTDSRRDVQQFFYAPDNTLTGITTNNQPVLGTAFDGSFSPGVVRDGNNNQTTTLFTSNGLPISVTNALNQTTQRFYDSRNNLIKQIDAQNVTSLFRYDAYDNVISQTLGITTTSAVRATTLYTYTASGTRLTDVRAPDGVITHYDYDAAYPNRPQANKQTVGYGTPLAQVTTYGYDSFGRVVTTTVGFGTPLARLDVTRYNADNTLQKTIQNYKDGVFSAAKPDEDLITNYSYDGLGRQTTMQDVSGKYPSAVHYDSQGRVDWTVQNPRDASGNPVIPSTLPTYSPTRPDANVVTRYQYDGLGRTVLVTETGILTGTFNTTTQQFSAATTRTTRTEYDALSRPVTVTLNYQAGLSATADRNVQLLTRYDGASNVIAQRDALGRWTTTGYDALNRVISTTVNLDDGNPATGGTDTDITTVTTYDRVGRVIRTTDNYQDGTFTATQPLTDRIALRQYDPLGRITQTTQNAAGTTAPELNRITVTAYNLATNRVNGTQDPTGRWISRQYDVLGRVTRTIQNCRNASNAAVSTGCDTFSASTNDKNVPLSTAYDVLNRTTLITDANGVVTRTTYDGVGRPQSTIQNYVSGGPTTTITNVTTLQGYNGLGQTVVMTDATGAVLRQSFDGLGHTVVMTDAVSRVNRQGYDGTGTPRWSRTPDGRYTVMQVDGLGRVRTTIANYQNGQADASDAVDQDRITQTTYDAAGRPLQQSERGSIANHVTQYAYDNRDHLIAVTENVASGTCAIAPCNVITRYGYDRAGNRFKHTDANNHTRTWSYDAADELVGATDALNRTTSWSYDARGLVTGQTDPRGSGYNLTYGYDGVRRQKTITAGSSTNLATITLGYDSVGRRLSMADGTGTTTFRYDPLGRTTQLSAPNTGTVKYGYNARGDRTQLTYPDSTVIDYTYLNDGQLDLVKQGATTLADYGYDSAGRLQTVAAANGTTTTSTYDGLDQLRDLRTTKSGADLSRFQYGVDRRGLRTTITETLALSTTTTTGGALGTNTIGDQIDSNNPGLAEAFQATATTSGPVDRLTIYIEPGNAATSVIVGLYSSGSGSTVGSLLAQTTISSPTAGAWNTGSISSVTLTAGTTYWIAVLGPTTTGSVRFRDRTAGTNVGISQTSSQTTLNSLPSTWSAGTNFNHAPLSAYAFLSSGGSGPAVRTITNGYDGLERLTSSIESGATSNSFSYGYDAAGNRTSVTANGTTTTTSYDAANQISNTGYVYDAAGNLTSDGSTTSTYDALNRMTARGSTTYAYNGDGTLVSQTTSSVTTRYTQDLAAPLTQILQQGSTDYVYGLTRLYGSVSGTKTWYGTDALGSVRQTINNSGVPQGIINYDPWGNVESGSVPTFGFTGELQDNAAGQVYLRARWYSTPRGAFQSRDPYTGVLEHPYSQHPYAYGLSNPLLYTDHSGQWPDWPDTHGWNVVQGLSLSIRTVAKWHIPPGTFLQRFDWQTLATIMGAHIAIESNVGEQLYRRAAGDLQGYFTGNPSTGVANIRPSQALDLLKECIPLMYRETYAAYVHNASIGYYFESNGTLDPVTAQRLAAYDLLQNDLYSVDFLAGRIVDAIRQISATGRPLSIFLVSQFLQFGSKDLRSVFAAYNLYPSVPASGGGHGIEVVDIYQTAAQTVGVTATRPPGLQFYLTSPQAGDTIALPPATVASPVPEEYYKDWFKAHS